ncbi:septum formation initiator family protein [Desulfosarcina sp.]|uniref:septum formation initiator family protein n=1 Tax=Desulfosarcina sp. TaxID=2027861 RepID=UPI0039708998
MAAPGRILPRRTLEGSGKGQDSTGNRKVRPPGKTMTSLWMVLMALFFVQALFYAWCRVQCVNVGYGIDRENQRHQALLKERNTLKIELARLKSPERIETIARTRLGLIMPDSEQTVALP